MQRHHLRLRRVHPLLRLKKACYPCAQQAIVDRGEREKHMGMGTQQHQLERI